MATIYKYEQQPKDYEEAEWEEIDDDGLGALRGIVNAVKMLAGIPDHLHLISPTVVESIGMLRKDLLGQGSISLNLEETLIALSINSTTNPSAHQAMLQLPKLSGCELHLTHLPTPGDERGLRRLGVNLTCDPSFASTKLFVS